MNINLSCLFDDHFIEKTARVLINKNLQSTISKSRKSADIQPLYHTMSVNIIDKPHDDTIKTLAATSQQSLGHKKDSRILTTPKASKKI